MATPPTRVASGSSAFNTGGAKTISGISVLAGDLVEVRVSGEGGGSGFGQTFTCTVGGTGATQAQFQEGANEASEALYTFTVSADGTVSIVVNDTESSFYFGFDYSLWRGSDGFGNSAKTNSSGAPSLSLTTAADNSAVVVGASDWNAVDGTSRTWRTVNGSAMTEETYFRDSSRYTVFTGYRGDAGVAGSKTLGLSAPTGTLSAMVGLEIKGAAAAGGSRPVKMADQWGGFAGQSGGFVG
jgi:hypothetical protein